MRYVELKREAKRHLDNGNCAEAMEIYNQAAKVASEEGADPIEVAKCYTNESQMAFKLFHGMISQSNLIQQALNTVKMLIRSRDAAKLALDVCLDWSKGYLYFVRALSIIPKRDDNVDDNKLVDLLDEYIDRTYPHLIERKLEVGAINDSNFWYVLKLVNHPLYEDFIKRQPGYDAIKFSSNVFYVNPNSAGCFSTITDALVFARFKRKPFSILVEPGVYENDFGLRCHNLGIGEFLSLKTLEINVVGNRLPYKTCDFQKLNTAISSSIINRNELSAITDVLIVFREKSFLVGEYIYISRVAFISFGDFSLQVQNGRFSFNNSYAASFDGNDQNRFIIGEKTNINIEESYILMKDRFLTLFSSKALISDSTIITDVKAIWLQDNCEANLVNVDVTCKGIVLMNSKFNAINCEFKDCDQTESRARLRERGFNKERRSFDTVAWGLFVLHTSKAKVVSSKIIMDEKEETDAFAIGDSDSRDGECELILIKNEIFVKTRVLYLSQEAFKGTLKNNKFVFLGPMPMETVYNVISLNSNEKIVLSLYQNAVSGRPGINFDQYKGFHYYDIVSRNPREQVSVIGDDPSFLTAHWCLKDSPGHIRYDIHPLRQTKEGRKQSQAGHKICRFCVKVDSAGSEFKYCVDCKVTSYCSKECQRKHWKKGHKEECAKLRQWLL